MKRDANTPAAQEAKKVLLGERIRTLLWWLLQRQILDRSFMQTINIRRARWPKQHFRPADIEDGAKGLLRALGTIDPDGGDRLLLAFWNDPHLLNKLLRLVEQGYAIKEILTTGRKPDFKNARDVGWATIEKIRERVAHPPETEE
jgi:hypothetical protein